MKKIKLSNGMTALIDDRDYKLVADWKWHAKKDRNGVVYATTHIYVDGKRIMMMLMHRLILNAQPGQYCDHRNGDGLDNRRTNIHICSQSANQQNARKRRGCSSDFIGVGWHKALGKWRAQIRVNGIHRHLGLFEDEKEAAAAYADALFELRGHLPRTEFVDEPIGSR